MLTAFFDSSGDQPPALVVAGWLFDSRGRSRFDKEWGQVLDEADISCFHMVDFAHSKKAFQGWKGDEETKKHWQPKDWMLHYDGGGKELRTQADFRKSEFIADFRFPAKGGKPCAFLANDGADGYARIRFNAEGKIDAAGKVVIRTQGPGVRIEESTQQASAVLKPPGQWNRLHLTLAKPTHNWVLAVNGKPVAELNKIGYPTYGAFTLRPEGEMDFANIFVRPLDQK